MSKFERISSHILQVLLCACCQHIRDLSLRRIFLSLCLLQLMTSFSIAQPQSAVPRFWGMKQGDKFVFSVAGSRRTEIAVDGQPPTTQETSDSLQIQLTAVDFERNGDITFRVDVQRIDRRPDTAGPVKTNVPQLYLRVQPDGKVSTLNPEIREMLVATLANGDPEPMNILKKCLTEESIASWFSVAFWSRGPAEDAEQQNLWQRSHEVSLGTLGTLSMDMSFTPRETEDAPPQFAINGEARFRPLVLPDADTATFPFFSNVSVDIDEVSGSATRPRTPAEANKTLQHFLFDSVDWTLRLHGEARLINTALTQSSGTTPSSDQNPDATKSDTATGKVTFRQTQHYTWKLLSFESASRRLFEFENRSVPLR